MAKKMFIDSHAHIDGHEFDADRDEVIQRAQAAGVSVILNVGTGDPHSGALERAVELGEAHESIYTAIGTHPHDARLYNDSAEAKIKNLINDKHVIAWGEIGLDFHYDNSPRDVQIEVFKRQLRAARECDLPVVIHTREAEAETIEILKSEYDGAQRRGVFHCFSGSMNLARRSIEIGFMISFSGIVTFKKADELRAVAKEVPLDRLLIETDCPYLTPIPYRGKRNEPAYVVEVARALATLHGVDIEDMARITSENFNRFFGL
ncbi:MAG TPA: TatD family hydrolase [Pyrinomonadaceae bacterium]|nr:TatD family hydrolase [Pyrinomonadaceae bacterium]